MLRPTALLLCAACATPVAPPPDAAMAGHLDAARFPAAAALLTGCDEPGADSTFAPGDRALFGLRLVRGDQEQRWLLWLQAAPTALGPAYVVLENRDGTKERVPVPAMEVMSPTQSWNYTAIVDGARRDYRIDSALLPVNVQVLDADDGTRLGSSHVQLPADLLRHGLVPAVEAARVLAALVTPPDSTPRPAAELAAIEEHVKSQVRGAITTLALLSVVQEDSVLADYFWQIVQKPSLWSVITHLGVSATLEVRFDAAVAASDLPGHWVVPAVVDVNGSPAVFADLLVGPSRRPFALCGGIKGASARYPARDDLRFELTLLAARAGPPAALSPAGTDRPMLDAHERSTRQQP